MKTGLTGFLLGVFLFSIAVAKEVKSPDWLKKIPAPAVGTFPLPKAGELHYTAGWSGMVAGKVGIAFTQTTEGQTLHFTGKTVGVVRALYALDGDATAVCDPTTLQPHTSTIVETYSDEKRTTVLHFSPEKMTRQRSSVPAQKDDGKTKTLRLPHLLDLQSSLLYLRSQPLAVGDEITFLTYATGSPYVAKVTVVAQEKITVPAGDYTALKLHLALTGIDKKLQLKPYKKAKNITAWISNDADRHFLKFTADLLIGNVFVELEK